jgi:hypothetical protein
MARMHGSQVRVYLNELDVSSFLTEVSPRFGAETEDVTTFASAGWRESQAGLRNWEVGLTGFHDPAEGAISRKFETLLGTSGAILSIVGGDANTALTDYAWLFAGGVLSSREQPVEVASLMKLTGTLTGSGRASTMGRLMHPLGAETETGDGTGLGNGGKGQLLLVNWHVTAVTGTWGLRIQESDNDGDPDAYADLAVFSPITEPGSYSLLVTQNDTYIRERHTENVAGSITYVCTAGYTRPFGA